MKLNLAVSYVDAGEKGHVRKSLECSDVLPPMLCAVTTLIVFLVLLWMSEVEKEAVKKTDLDYVSVDDFTFRIDYIPSPKKVPWPLRP